MFQTRESSTPKKSSLPLSGSSSSAADPLSTIQTKADAFEGLDPLSMFAAQEVSSKLPATTPVKQKERVSWIDISRANYQVVTSYHAQCIQFNTLFLHTFFCCLANHKCPASINVKSDPCYIFVLFFSLLNLTRWTTKVTSLNPGQARGLESLPNIQHPRNFPSQL